MNETQTAHHWNSYRGKACKCKTFLVVSFHFRFCCCWWCLFFWLTENWTNETGFFLFEANYFNSSEILLSSTINDGDRCAFTKSLFYLNSSSFESIMLRSKNHIISFRFWGLLHYYCTWWSEPSNQSNKFKWHCCCLLLNKYWSTTRFPIFLMFKSRCVSRTMPNGMFHSLLTLNWFLWLWKKNLYVHKSMYSVVYGHKILRTP